MNLQKISMITLVGFLIVSLLGIVGCNSADSDVKTYLKLPIKPNGLYNEPNNNGT
jgi:hypothetical protein